METCGNTLGSVLMHEQLFYSPQAQLDLDEIFDYFSNELNDPDKGHGIVGDILTAAERIPGRALRYVDEYGIILFVKSYERSCRANYQASVGFEELPRSA